MSSELRRLEDGARTSIGIGRTDATERIEGELSRYFSGESASFETPLALVASPFTPSVWSALKRIPIGETRSYGELAMNIGHAASARAVARACGANQISIVVPCHRLIGMTGDLTGYGGGIWRKRWLLDHEARMARSLTAAGLPEPTYAAKAHQS